MTFAGEMCYWMQSGDRNLIIEKLVNRNDLVLYFSIAFYSGIGIMLTVLIFLSRRLLKLVFTESTPELQTQRKRLLYIGTVFLVAYVTRACADGYVAYMGQITTKVSSRGLRYYATYVAPFIFIFSEIVPTCLMLWNHHITFSAVERATSLR